MFAFLSLIDEFHCFVFFCRSYFKATVVGHPEYQHVFKVSDETTNAPHKLECIDCNGKSDDEECSFSTVAFSRNSSYYCLTCAGPNVPKTTVYDKVF